MAVHQFDRNEMAAATGLTAESIGQALERFSIDTIASVGARENADRAGLPGRPASTDWISRRRHATAAGNEVQRIRAVEGRRVCRGGHTRSDLVESDGTARAVVFGPYARTHHLG